MSAEHNIHSTPNSIRALIDERAALTPEATFLVNPATDEAISYRTLRSQVRAVANNIAIAGVKDGEAVAYAMSNSTQTAIIILGILYGGYLATAINLVSGTSVIEYVLEHSEAKLVIANDAGVSALRAALNKRSTVPAIIVDELFFTSDRPYENGDENVGGLLMYTSGTTGRPKGVVLTHSNLIAGGQNTAIAHELSAADSGLCVLPLYHINGLCVTLMGALVSGGTLVVPAKFSVSNFWQTIIKHGCTWFSVVPTQISYLLHEDSDLPEKSALTKVRFGRSASAPLSPDVQSAFEEKFGIAIIETMGLTETAAQILSNPLPPGIRKIGTPGIPFGNEVVIVDGNQTELPRNIEGEVLVRGPNVMSHYLKNVEATKDAITDDGWLRTGDLGRMDDDGYVYITGRLKELIIKGGENIAPREIDEALYTHPAVIEAAAFARKCEQYGETVEAAVMVAASANVDENELIELCREALGDFKTPDRIHFLPELPKGPSGKIQRSKLADHFS